MGKERLDKILSHALNTPRSEIKALLKKSFVTVNKIRVTDGAFKVDTVNDVVEVDKRNICLNEFVYYMLNKPAGYVSATNDNFQDTVLDLIKENKKDLFPVGRLDKDTVGLLLITNDGKLCHELLSPSKHVEKEYLVKVDSLLEEKDILAFEDGIDIGDDKKTKEAQLEIISANENESTALVIIKEGRFHQVKRMFKALGHEVIYLKRNRMGSLELDSSLEEGQYRELTNEEIKGLKDAK